MKLRLTTSSLALALVAAPAFALTPQEVWDDWSAYYASFGYTVAVGASDAAGETLTLKDVVLATGEEGDRVTISVPQIVLQGTGDGGVRTTFSDSAAAEIVVSGEDGEPGTAQLTIAMPGAEVVTSGELPDTTTAMKAPEVTVTIDRIDPPEGPHLDDVATITLDDLKGETQASDGGRTRTTSSTLAGLDYRVSATSPDGSVDASGRITAMTGQSRLVMPASGLTDLASRFDAALRDGLATSGSFTMGRNEHKWDVTTIEDGDEQAGSVAVTADEGSGDLSLDKERLSYRVTATGVGTTVNSESFPLPVDTATDSFTMSLDLPLMKADAPQPFGFSYGIEGLTVSDNIWALFDPDGKLPRDPADLALELSGMTKVSRDLFDPALADEAGGEADDETGDGAADDGDDDELPVPFAPTELKIDRFALSALGAAAEAAGELTVPEDGSLEEPVGHVDATLTGSNALIEKLTGMGLLPQDQLQAVRMMLAMFTKPGEGPDTLVSNIEFKEGGSVFINGQQIK